MLTFSAKRKMCVAEFIDVMNRSTLGERRPVEDEASMEAMFKHANLMVTGWDGDKLVCVARSLTDFHFCCYLSDLAVDASYQRSGTGRRLVTETARRLEPDCKLILLSAPKAQAYYPKIGFSQHPSAWFQKASELR